MSWIDDAIGGTGFFKSIFSRIKSVVYEYCDFLIDKGATVDEAHAMAMGYFGVLTEGTITEYLYLKYVEDWAIEAEEADDVETV